jgi:hypothetical protein
MHYTTGLKGIAQRSFFTVVCFLGMLASYGQDSMTLADSISMYFNEVKEATGKAQKLWNKDLYGPLMIVNPFTRQIYTNYPDTAGLLQAYGKVYRGMLPGGVVIGNAPLEWGGRKWAMIMSPFISADKHDRLNLFAHELFHLLQPALQLQAPETSNNHLDTKDGRSYLRLELEALKKAVQSNIPGQRKLHLTNALIFRKYRYLLFPGADTLENFMELNEGITEYTGTIVAGRSMEQTFDHFIKKIDELIAMPAFVRMFPYRTTPVYGYLLYLVKKDWNKEITLKTDLTAYFIKSFAITLPEDISKSALSIADQYGGQKIFAGETEREEKKKRQLAEYRKRFIEQAHFEIPFEQKRVSFDARYIVTLDDKGIVYPVAQATDNWGSLTVSAGGLLMSPDRNKAIISVPLKIEGEHLSGDGWTLKLNKGYTVEMDKNSGNYRLIKK